MRKFVLGLIVSLASAMGCEFTSINEVTGPGGGQQITVLSVIIGQMSSSTLRIGAQCPESLAQTKLSATVTMSNGSVRSDSVSWHSTNPSVAEVSEIGFVTGKLAGQTDVYAQFRDKKSLPVRITVVNQSCVTVANDSVALFPKSATQQAGTTLQLGSFCRLNGQTCAGYWTSTNPQVVSVQGGLLTFGSVAGVVAVCIQPTSAVASPKDCGSFTTIVAPSVVTVTDLVLSASSVTLYTPACTSFGPNTFVVNWTVLPSNATNQLVSVASSNIAVATVATAGSGQVMITGVSVGSVTITFTTSNPSVVKTVQVTVLGCAVSITDLVLSASSVTLYTPVCTNLGPNTFVVSWTVVPSNATNSTVTVVSNNTTVATVTVVGSGQVMITGVSVGSVTITFTTSNPSVVKTVQVTVLGCAVPITRTVEMVPPGASRPVGSTLQGSAVCKENGVVVTCGTLWWSSDQSSVIGVEARTGKIVFGPSKGSAIVCVQWQNLAITPWVVYDKACHIFISN